MGNDRRCVLQSVKGTITLFLMIKSLKVSLKYPFMLTSTVHFAIENSNNLEVTEAQLRCNASGVTLSQKDI